MTSGILLVEKQAKKTSFSIISSLRKKLGVSKIGHAGTLDPFATGVMVILVGKEYTKKSDTFLTDDKEYTATIKLGAVTKSYDPEEPEEFISDKIPSLEEIERALSAFNGKVEQIPPMYSAKKVGGKKLYHLARKGIEIERKAALVDLKTTLIYYNYPFLQVHISCSKGTYIRSVAHDLGQSLGCGAYLYALVRTRSGPFHLHQCVKQEQIQNESCDITKYLQKI